MHPGYIATSSYTSLLNCLKTPVQIATSSSPLSTDVVHGFIDVVDGRMIGQVCLSVTCPSVTVSLSVCHVCLCDFVSPGERA